MRTCRCVSLSSGLKVLNAPEQRAARKLCDLLFGDGLRDDGWGLLRNRCRRNQQAKYDGCNEASHAILLNECCRSGEHGSLVRWCHCPPSLGFVATPVGAPTNGGSARSFSLSTGFSLRAPERHQELASPRSLPWTEELGISDGAALDP